MITRLKLKLILITMLIVAAVCLAAFAFLYSTTEQGYYDDSIEAMKLAVDSPFDFDTHFDVGKGSRKNRNGIVTFYVTVRPDGTAGALIGNNVTVTNE